MKVAALLFAFAALAVPVSAAGEHAQTSGTVLAIERGRVDSLVRLDRRTLQPRGPKLALQERASTTHAFSPDGRRLAIPVFRGSSRRPIHGLRIVDPRRMRSVRRVWLRDGFLSEVAWLSPRRIVGFGQEGPFSVDPVSGTALQKPAVPPEVRHVRRVGKRLVFVYGWPRWTIGRARLSVVDASGRTRSVLLRRIKAGARLQGDQEGFDPGVAIDPAGRAFVVGGRDEPIAEVDLTTLRVRYHDLPKDAKDVAGRTRRAIWLGGGRIAVWGDDVTRNPPRMETTPTGLFIVDLRQKRYETVDRESRWVAFTAGTLLASGWGTGIRGYSTAGQRLYEVFAGEEVIAHATFGERAFIVGLLGEPPGCRVINARTGTLVQTRRGVPAVLDPAFVLAVKR